MTEINEKVKYFSQRRLTMPGEKPGAWEKCCGGHPTLYEAVTCLEIARGALLGEPDRHDKSIEMAAMDAQIHANFLAMLAAGVTVELCVAKFTVTREMIENYGPLSCAKVQPKKEAP